MEIKQIGDHILINADHTEALRYLANNNYVFDLIVEDPDYRNIGKNFKTDHYDNLYKILKSKCVMLHYTYNTNGRSNCPASALHILIPNLINKKFRHKSNIFWNKYFGQELQPHKLSHERSATPNDIDILILMLKHTKQFPKHLNMKLICKKSGMLYHSANQKQQYKPHTLCKDIILALSISNNVILDTHMGSANLGVECINLGRRYVGIESDKRLFDDAVEKLTKLI